MVASELQPLSQVKAVRVMPLVAGIQMQLIACLSFRLISQPVHQLPAQPGTLHLGQSNQVIHVQHPAPREVMRDPEAGGSHRTSTLQQEDNPEPFALLDLQTTLEFRAIELRPQHIEYLEAKVDVS